MQTVTIELDGVERAPYFDFFRPAIAESQELDFHLPGGEFRVRVLDAATGEGIREAAVEIRNGYVLEREDDTGADRRGLREKREKAVFQSTETNETGVAVLPPIREGTLEIRASAEGYAKMREPLKAQVFDDNADQTFEIRLEPIGEAIALRLRLPNGTPAADAELLLVDSLATGRELFSARADAEGRARLPSKQAGFILVKHPAAAFLVREWRPEEVAEEVEWALPSAADRLLTIQVKDGSGTSAAAHAELALWVGGRRLSGRTLGWLAGTSALADANGYWVGRNLPPGPVSVLAWALRAREEAWEGSLDAQATAAGYPWPAPVVVRAVE